MNVLKNKIINLIALWLILFVSGINVRGDVLRLKIDDGITPASAEVIVFAVDRAEREKFSALIITLSTPGGLETSTREIVKRIIASRVPVIVFVAPSGSRAASAGFIILISADIAAMAPGTATGAAHPVPYGGGEPDKTMNEKVVNDAAAWV